MKQLTYYFKQMCIIELSSKYFMLKYSQHIYGDFSVLHSEKSPKNVIFNTKLEMKLYVSTI